MRSIDLLKSCPFCGRSAKIAAGISDTNGETFYFVRCKSCGARGRSYTDSQTRNKSGTAAAIEAWNRRIDSRTFPAAETPEKGRIRAYYPENAGGSFTVYNAATPAETESKMKQNYPDAAEDPETTGAELSEDPGQDPDTTPAEDPAANPEAKNQEDDPQPVNFA